MLQSISHPTLTIRIHAGFNADACLAGLLALSDNRFFSAQELLEARFPESTAKLLFEPVSVNHIAGHQVRFELPHEHVHRTLTDIASIYDRSALSEAARATADVIWTTIAQAEAHVHNADIAQVHFHEVGRMSNILAIGLIAELFIAMDPARIVASPLPMGDGSIRCAHGTVPNPAPATLAMLDGVAVCGWRGQGEPVTPTGLAILKGLQAQFGAWPTMVVKKHATVYAAGKYFDGVPNGTIFALGE